MDFQKQKDYLTKNQLQKYGDVKISPVGAILTTKTEVFFVPFVGFKPDGRTMVYDSMKKYSLGKLHKVEAKIID